MADAQKTESGLKVVTKSVTGPGSKVYDAVYLEVENFAQVENAVAEMGLSIADLNYGLRLAKKAVYMEALDSTVDSKIADAIKGLVAIGYSSDEATALAEAQRSKISDSLPKGLSPRMKPGTNEQVISSKGRPKVNPESQAA